jgi:hypothetical protein
LFDVGGYVGRKLSAMIPHIGVDGVGGPFAI